MDSDERRPLLDLPAEEEDVFVTNNAKKGPQFKAALIASLGALAAGTIIGWSAPAGPRITDGNEYGFVITKKDNAWIGSLIALGAAFICIPTGIMMDKIGRKTTMLSLIIPFTVGWLLIIFASNLPMLFVGRFIVGVGGGGFCVTVPAYTSEIAQDDIRGILGTFFQLMVVVGVSFAYIIGGYSSVHVMSAVCAIIPIVFAVAFAFMPETPYYLTYRDRFVEAKQALAKLRGPQYDIRTEFDQLHERVMYDRENPSNVRQMFGRKAAKRAFVICLSLMIFQQFSGINAILFNTTLLFHAAKAKLSPELSTIIIGLIQVFATLSSSFTIDRLGRRFLLLLSSFVMIVCNFALGFYFHLLKTGRSVDEWSWLPLTSLVVYIVAFSIGFGPIPWLVSGEVCSPDIKAFVSSFAGGFNWFLAFVITRSFEQIENDIGLDGTFWMFYGLSILGLAFVYYAVPETKGKSIDEIQTILSE